MQFYWEGNPDGADWENYSSSASDNFLKFETNSYGVNENLEFKGSLTCLNVNGTNWPNYIPLSNENVASFVQRTDTQYRFLIDVYDANEGGGALNVRGSTYVGFFYVYFTMKRNN